MSFLPFLTRPRGATLAALGCLLTSCGSADGSSSYGKADDSGAAFSPDVSDGTRSNAQSVTVSFAEVTTQPILALSRPTVEVFVLPKAEYQVELALVGESADASLNVNTVTTNSRGKASIQLTAPTAPTTFRIRATVDYAITTEFEVTVVDATTGILSVDRAYTGTRTPSSYVISLFPGADCSQDTLDSATPSQTYEVTETSLPLDLDNVPIGTTLAVQLTGDKLVYGCSVVSTSSGQQAFSTTVTLLDLPVQLTDATLDVALSAANEATVLASDLQALATKLLSAYQSTANDLVALLDQMQSVALGDIKAEFLATRSSSNWDETVKSDYASRNGETLLRRQLQSLVDPTVARLKSDQAFELTLELAPSEVGAPLVSIDRIADLNPETCQVTTPVSLSRSLDPADQLSWSTEFSYNPSTLLDCAIDTHATEAVPLAATTTEALATLFDCSAFAQNLDRYVTWSNTTSRTCNVACLFDLCRKAIGVMYERASSAVSNDQRATLTLSATGAVKLDGNARPVSTQGTWLGRYTTTDRAPTVSGFYAPL